MKANSWLTGIVLVAGLGLSTAAEPPQKSDSTSTPVAMTAADSLDIIMDQWYQFTLAGDDSQASALEHDIIRLLNIDINQTQERLSSMLERARNSQAQADASFAKIDARPTPLHDSTDFLRSTLSVKKLLLGSITRSDAFSNKYRLLGDYVELLRREVGLPKLRLAAEKSTEAQKN